MISDFLRDLIHLLPLSLAICLGLFSDSKAAIALLCLGLDFLFLFLLYQKKQKRLLISVSLLILILVYFLINGLSSGTGKFVLISIICLFALFFIKSIERYSIGRYLMTGSCLFLILLSIISKTTIEKIVFLPFFFYLLINIIEIIQIRWPKQGDTNLNMHSLYLAPFLLLMVLMLARFQIPDRPYEWAFLKDTGWWIRARWESFAGKYNTSSSNDSDSLFTGFSDVASLGNGLYKSSRRIMNVGSTYYGKDTIKLNGKTFDTFEDLRWIKTDESPLNYRIYDILESLCAVIPSGKNIYFDYLRNTYLDIDCSGIVTAHVFNPLKSVPNIERTALYQSGGDLFFDSAIKRPYKIRYYHFFKDSEDFEKIINDLKPVDAATFNEALQIVTSADPRIYTYEGYKAYQKTIQDTYCLKPELSTRTARLLEETCKDAASDYEKMLAIEKLLSSMQYDLGSGELPETVNSTATFLDYLLFESKKGYCVHYATAFVLLARAQGLPARFVQGYAFSLRNGRADIRSYMAHAWPEVYLDGFGWLDFEPTPSRSTDSTQGSASITETPDSADDLIQNNENKNRISFRAILFVCAASMFILFLVFRAINRMRFIKLSSEQKVKTLFKQNLRLLKRMGSGLRKSETLSEYALRLNKTPYSQAADIFPIYEKLIYGNRIVDENDVVLFKESRELLLRSFFDQLFNRIRKQHYEG